MNNTICLNSMFSTTRKIILERPDAEKDYHEVFESLLFLPTCESRIGEGGLRKNGFFKRSIHKMPLLTIVTVVFNAESTIEDSIKSVIFQSYDNIEYIVIDGGSNDNTLDIIKKYNHAIDYWISEKDSGIYEAMNKALSVSNGKYIFFMGADDELIENGIKKLFFNFFEDDRNLLALPVKIKNKIKMAYPKISSSVSIVHHQGAVFNRKCLKVVGLYSEEYKIHSDFDLMCRYIRSYGVRFLDIPICTFTKGGKSTSGSNLIFSVKELLDIYFRNGGSLFSPNWAGFIIRPIYYYFRGFIVRK